MPKSPDANDVFEAVRSFAVTTVEKLPIEDRIDVYEELIDDMQARIDSLEDALAGDDQ